MDFFVFGILKYSLTASNFSSTDRTIAKIKTDDQDFLRLIAREYYRILGTRTREKDPNRLILGERFLVGDHPDLVLEEQNKWIDAIAFQPGGSLNQALSKSYILGYSQCQYISREVGSVLKQGLLDINGEPYGKLVESVTETNKSIMKRFAEVLLTE